MELNNRNSQLNQTLQLHKGSLYMGININIAKLRDGNQTPNHFLRLEGHRKHASSMPMHAKINRPFAASSSPLPSLKEGE